MYYKNNKYEHYRVSGIYRKKDSTIYFKEDSTLAVKLGLMASNVLGNYTMNLNVNDTSLLFKGRWKDNKKTVFGYFSTSVFLQKKISQQIKTSITSSKDSLPYVVEDKLTRKVDIQSLIELKRNEKDSIKFEIYDNGDIDGDVVSLYLNDSLIVFNKRISAQPITFFLNLNTSVLLNKVKLVAESLGSIPPCTALIIVSIKSKRYEVFLSSQLQSNAVIEFFLK